MDDNLMSIFPPPAKRRRLTFDDEKDETLVFPEPILYYLKKNSSPKLLLKLMQSSKYFCFKEFPFMVVEDLEYDKKWRYMQRKNEKYQLLDMENLTKPLWITKYLYLHDPPDSKLASKLLSKIAVCDADWIRLDNQILTFNEFKAFTSSKNFDSLQFCFTHVEYENGTIIPVEEILKCLPKLDFLECELNEKMQSTFTTETTMKIIKNLNASIFSKFSMSNIPQFFDFKLFSDFMDANPTIDFDLNFNGPLTPEYTKMLQDYVDKLIETGEPFRREMLISFPGQTDESFANLFDTWISFF